MSTQTHRGLPNQGGPANPGALRESMGLTNLWLLAVGGIAYSIGALFYAFKWPKLKPAVFGYHELFHVFTVIGAVIHFVVIYRLID